MTSRERRKQYLSLLWEHAMYLCMKDAHYTTPTDKKQDDERLSEIGKLFHRILYQIDDAYMIFRLDVENDGFDTAELLTDVAEQMTETELYAVLGVLTSQLEQTKELYTLFKKEQKKRKATLHDRD